MSRVSSAERIRELFPARLEALTSLATGSVLDLGTVDVGTARERETIRAGAPYDTIVSVGVLVELAETDQLDQAVRLLAEVLAPDGRVLFAEPQTGSRPDVRDAMWRGGLTVIESRPWRRRSKLTGWGGRAVIGGVARLTPARPPGGDG